MTISCPQVGSWFGGLESIKELKLGEEVTSIGDEAFSHCYGLTSATIPNSVTSIGDFAFAYCNGLTSVNIPNSVTSIGYEAFVGCSNLTSVTIPNSVTSIGDEAFADCYGLTDVYCYAKEVPSTETYVFNDSNIENATLHVPASAIDSYKETEPWSGFGTIVAIEGEEPVEEKCATPSISYVGGKVTFSCDTEDVEYVCEVTFPNTLSGSGAKVTLSDKTMLVKVYATKEGYKKSDTATKKIKILSGGLQGDIDGNGTVTIADVTKLVNIIVEKEGQK